MANPARQVRLVRVLAAEPVTLVALDGPETCAVGQLCVATGTSDVVDAAVRSSPAEPVGWW